MARAKGRPRLHDYDAIIPSSSPRASRAGNVRRLSRSADSTHSATQAASERRTELVISPELCLVCPELRAIASKLLPERDADGRPLEPRATSDRPVLPRYAKSEPFAGGERAVSRQVPQVVDVASESEHDRGPRDHEEELAARRDSAEESTPPPTSARARTLRRVASFTVEIVIAASVVVTTVLVLTQIARL